MHGFFLWMTKKWITISNALQMVLDNRKPNKIWVDQGNKFYDRLVRLWLQDKDIKIYSAHKEGKFVAVERFITT